MVVFKKTNDANEKKVFLHLKVPSFQKKIKKQLHTAAP